MITRKRDQERERQRERETERERKREIERKKIERGIKVYREKSERDEQ